MKSWEKLFAMSYSMILKKKTLMKICSTHPQIYTPTHPHECFRQQSDAQRSLFNRKEYEESSVAFYNFLIVSITLFAVDIATGLPMDVRGKYLKWRLLEV